MLPKLFFGGVSRAAVEAIYEYSHNHRLPLGLLISENQVGISNGYVADIDTFMSWCNAYKNTYPESTVMIERDHCGDGFCKNPEETIEVDSEHNLPIVHIDTCQFEGGHREKLKRCAELCRLAITYNPSVILEVGTEHNNQASTNLEQIREDIVFLRSYEIRPTYFVTNTGSLVTEGRQVGEFRRNEVDNVAFTLAQCGTYLKEHNADFLSLNHLRRRAKICDALNIAPQLGSVESLTIVTEGYKYGCFDELDKWGSRVHTNPNLKKWFREESSYEKSSLSDRLIIGGHYEDRTDLYQAIPNLHETVKENIKQVIHHYVRNFK